MAVWASPIESRAPGTYVESGLGGVSAQAETGLETLLATTKLATKPAVWHSAYIGPLEYLCEH